MPADKPPAVSLNLDTLEREPAAQQRPPFVVVADGKAYELRDPGDIDWKILRNFYNDPVSFINSAFENAKKRDEFNATVGDMPSWKIAELTSAWMQHYGLPNLPE